MADSEILELFRQRDERALHEIRTQYGKTADTMAYRILGNREDVEEALSDALFALWDAIPPAAPDSLPAYFYTLVRNRCFDMLEKRNAEKRGGGQMPLALEELAPYLSAPGHPEDILSQITLQDALTRFLGSLTPEHRMIFLARYWSFQPIAEIAEHHNSTQGRVKMILRRTKEKLRIHLEKEGLL